MELNLVHLAQLLAIVAQCPSGGYCLKAMRLDCAACPYKPGRKEAPADAGKPGI